jgi:hypothetical protein
MLGSGVFPGRGPDDQHILFVTATEDERPGTRSPSFACETREPEKRKCARRQPDTASRLTVGNWLSR